MGHGAPGEPGADPAHADTCAFDKWQEAENEMRRRAECYPSLLAALKATRDVIHLHFCQAGDKGGNKECWKECRVAQEVIRAAS